MNKFTSILFIIITLTVIAFAALDRREGLWHKAPKQSVQQTDSIPAVTDSTTIDSIKIEIEPLVDTTHINL